MSINNLGHMIKMAAMPIYGKNPLEFFFSGTTGPISTKLGIIYIYIIVKIKSSLECTIILFRMAERFHDKYQFSKPLTHLSLASVLWDIGKQNSPRYDAAERGVPSGAILFA